jgi:hypothetical protein
VGGRKIGLERVKEFQPLKRISQETSVKMASHHAGILSVSPEFKEP